MVAEHTADPGDASSPWPKPKCWDVTSSSGFALWKLNIEALINSDEGVQLFCGVNTITPAIMPHLDAHFAARPPAQQADALLIYKESHAKCVNTIYRRILATIDISHDSTLLRIIDTEFAPQIGKRPAQIWRLLDLLFSRGSRSLTTSQIEIENRVTSWQIPFGKSPLEIARSFLTFVADWWDLETNIGATPRLIVRTLVARMRQGGAHWQQHANAIELDAAKDITAFDDLPALIRTWEQTIFVFFSSKDGNEPVVSPIHGDSPSPSLEEINYDTYVAYACDSSECDIFALRPSATTNDCSKCDLKICKGKPCVAFDNSPLPAEASLGQKGYALFVRYFLSKNPHIKNAKGLVLPKYDPESALSKGFKEYKEKLGIGKAKPGGRVKPVDPAYDPTVAALESEADAKCERWRRMSAAEQQAHLTELCGSVHPIDDGGEPGRDPALGFDGSEPSPAEPTVTEPVVPLELAEAVPEHVAPEPVKTEPAPPAPQPGGFYMQMSDGTYAPASGPSTLNMYLHPAQAASPANAAASPRTYTGSLLGALAGIKAADSSK